MSVSNSLSKSVSTSAPIESNAVRRAFLDYFRKQGHQEVASALLVPADDPTLLFTNAGMNQFKDYFTGKRQPPFARATTSQKCVRAGGKHNDLDNVGRTARHHTFFEMLGNFSFGDYFKPDAIVFAYELMVKTYGIDPKRLIYTVHESDGEARALWKKIAGIGDDRVISLGDKDNFWAMGETGPCGPCSEIHYHQDQGIPCAVEAAGGKCEGPACDCDRWVEIWNLVFMQFEQVAPGDRRPLPKPSVDTGMGLERLCAVLQGVRSNYETDLLRPLVDNVADLSKKKFVPTDYDGPSVSLRAIADHARAAAFLIADGVFPDKTGREYVLRRIMRRGIYHGWLLGIRGESVMPPLVRRVVDLMGGVYPALAERRELIEKITSNEESNFRETLERGMRILEDTMTKLRIRVIPGDVAFQLYDTYGFPLDLTRVIASQNQFTVDDVGYNRAMDRQRLRSEFHGSGEVAVAEVLQKIAEFLPPTEFVGYEQTTDTSKVVALLSAGEQVDLVTPYSKDVAVIVDKTPFYGEQGGQVGDGGTMSSAHALLLVRDCKRPVSTLWVHFVEVKSGELHVGEPVYLSVDVERRDDIRRNHSATHLLHWALRQILGTHVTQKGSLVASDRLRFDFSHTAPLTDDEKQKVEDLVNARVRGNVATDTAVLPIAEAKQAGAIAFFKITEETGVAQGVRRIEAVTGAGALAYVRRMDGELGEAGRLLRAGSFEIAARVAKLQTDLREQEKEIEKLRRKLASGGGRDLLSEARDIGGVRVLATRADVADPKALREVTDQLRDKLRSGVIVLAGVEGEKIALVAMVTPDLTGRFNAGKIVGEVAKAIGGKGGGRADMAQGGGSRPEQLDGALERVFDMIRG